MEDRRKKYYLETNALYSLVNQIDLITEKIDVATSLYAYEELINGISKRNFHKRKVVISKIKQSKLKIYPYSPIECIVMSFGRDISQIPIVKSMREELFDKIDTIMKSNDYEMYSEILKEKEGIHLSEIKAEQDNREKDSARILGNIVTQNFKDIKETKESQKNNPQYATIDIEKYIKNDDLTTKSESERVNEKGLLISTLNKINCSYEEEDINSLIGEYDGRQLVAFLLGLNFYLWNRSYYMKLPGVNDISDLNHLLYLKDEEYVIVSDDKIFSSITLFDMRISCDELLKVVHEIE